MASETIIKALKEASTEDLFYALSEILEPSHGGPLDRQHDWAYEPFMDELLPVADAYRRAFDGIEAAAKWDGCI